MARGLLVLLVLVGLATPARAAPPTRAMVRDWDRVVRGALPYATFRETHRPTNSQVGSLRSSLSAGQLQALSRDWLRVILRDRTVSAPDFLSARGYDKEAFGKLRKGREELFPNASHGRVYGKAELISMRADWRRVVAGEGDRPSFFRKWGLSQKSFDNLRDEHPDWFPKIEQGSLNRTRVSPAKVERMIEDWNERVVTGIVKVPQYLAEHHVSLKVFNAHVREPNSDRVPDAPRGKRKKLSEREGVDPYTLTPTKLTRAKAIVEAYRTEDFSREELFARLRPLGITPAVYFSGLRDRYPELELKKRNTKNYTKVQESEIRRMADALLSTFETHRKVIWRQSDLVEIANKDPSLQEVLGGQLTPGRLGYLHSVADAIGDHRLREMADAIRSRRAALPGNQERRAAARRKAAAGELVLEDRLSLAERKELYGDPSRFRAAARALAAALEGKTPSRKTYERVRSSVGKRFGIDDENMDIVRATHEGVLPELGRWAFGIRRPFTLRYVARLMESLHEAGPGASGDDLRRIFKQTEEHAERANSGIENQQFLGEKARNFPDLLVSPETRKRYQNARVLLEAVRTAPAGTTLTTILRSKPKGLTFSSVQMGSQLLDQVLGGLHREHLDQKTVELLRARGQGEGRYSGLGRKPDPSFDPNAEPPWINMHMVRAILDTPRVPPLLQHALKSLDGRRPLLRHHVLMINHRYSDIVPFTETLIAAGMEPKNSVFVSTPYPFDPAVTRQLEGLGLKTIIPEQDMASMKRAVEQGIREVLGRRTNRPILIVDDGGMATKVIEEKFADQSARFKIVEITAAGHRIARDLEQRHKRLPFLYYSIAYSALKAKVTSRFFARRVVEKALKLIDETPEIRLRNKRVAVLGGGPMGLFAGLKLRREGYQVTFVEPDPQVAGPLRDIHGFSVEPAEQALRGRGLVLGMSGYQSLDEKLIGKLEDGTIMLSGSSKRNEFDMEALSRRATSRELIPRHDGLSQRSYTYTLGRGSRRKQVHVLGDGWAFNHDGSLHGTPIDDIQLELAIAFESVVSAAGTSTFHAGGFRVLGLDVQQDYFERWLNLRREARRAARAARR